YMPVSLSLHDALPIYTRSITSGAVGDGDSLGDGDGAVLSVSEEDGSGKKARNIRKRSPHATMRAHTPQPAPVFVKDDKSCFLADAGSGWGMVMETPEFTYGKTVLHQENGTPNGAGDVQEPTSNRCQICQERHTIYRL